MKKTSLLSLLLAALMLVGCTGTTVEETLTTTTASTTEPAVTEKEPVPHIHMDSKKFPSEFDFSDTESMTKYFDMCEIIDGVQVGVQESSKQVILRGEVLDETFTLVVDLKGAEGYTTPEQVVTCAKLFWYCYPRLYIRYGKTNPNTPTSVTLKIENFGYEIASASGSEVHLYDQWLYNNKYDYDCLTHEFTHIIQGGWQGGYVPSKGTDTYMIERFADANRFLYAYQNGKYNDLGWELQTINTESSYDKSVRFWVWLDYTYSTPEVDILQRIAYFVSLRDRKYSQATWEPRGAAWKDVFKGTGAEGKNILQLWDEYAADPMAKLSSKANRAGSLSPLLQKTPLRTAIRDRYSALDAYLNCK